VNSSHSVTLRCAGGAAVTCGIGCAAKGAAGSIKASASHRCSFDILVKNIATLHSR
jgi:hypothetical protein